MPEGKRKKRKRASAEAVAEKHREEAWRQIRAAARRHGVELNEKYWREDKRA